MGRQVRLRSQLYAALAQAFQKPERASGGNQEDSLVEIVRQAAVTLDAEALGPAAERLLGALEVAQGQTEQAFETLEIEFNRLFVGPGPPQAPPYESFYRDRWGVLMGPSARDVERCYAEAGLALGRHHRDLPDHVATELGFMAYLAMREAGAKDGERETWLERERAFLRDHLSVWLPPLCRQVKEADGHPFYPALAELTMTFVDLDIQRLADSDPRGQLER